MKGERYSLFPLSAVRYAHKADFISGSSFLRTLVKEFLVDPIVWVVEATGDMWRN